MAGGREWIEEGDAGGVGRADADTGSGGDKAGAGGEGGVSVRG